MSELIVCSSCNVPGQKERDCLQVAFQPCHDSRKVFDILKRFGETLTDINNSCLMESEGKKNIENIFQ